MTAALVALLASVAVPCEAGWPTFDYGAAPRDRDVQGDAEPLTGEPPARLELALDGGSQEPESSTQLAAGGAGQEASPEERSAAAVNSSADDPGEQRPATARAPAQWGRRPQCQYAGPMEEKSDQELEALLVEASCPFVAAFFSGSSPLAYAEGLAAMERQVASAFPQIRYYRIDADALSMRAFLQWDITFLPTFVVFTPAARLGAPDNWYRWSGNGTSPYDFHTVAGFIQRAARLRPGNATTCPRLGGPPEGLPRRGDETWTQASLLGSWVLVGLAVLQRAFGRPLGGL